MSVHINNPSLTNLKLGLFRRFGFNVTQYQKQNHYDSLGITPKATQGDIKAAYYKLSKEYHPDKNEGNESAAEKFRNITAAYEILGNVKSRKVYDRGLLVGTTYEQEHKSEPVVDAYEHAPFYHHRNKPMSRKTSTNSTTNYDIDEWTRAHYSKTFEKKFERSNEAFYYKSQVSHTAKENWRTLPLMSVVIIVIVGFLMYGTDVNKKFDKPSKMNDKTN